MKVLCLATHPTLGAGGRLRWEQYIPHLRDHGIELEMAPFFDDAAYRILYRPDRSAAKAAGVIRGALRRLRDLRRLRRYDLVVVYLESAPLGPPLVEGYLRRIGIPYVFDFDDAIFLRAAHPTNRRWVSFLRPAGRTERTARAATTVIVGNGYLASFARRWNAHVEILPTPVDMDRHRPLAPVPARSSFTIGWLGSSTTARYLHLLDGVFTRLAARGDMTVRVVGGQYDHPTMPVDVRPYSLETEVADVATFDVGILPEPDDPWTKGKGAFKAVVYMAQGLPVVASRVGVNPDVILDGVTGFCALTDEEWVAALTRLAEDRGLRERLGAAGRERAERCHALRSYAPRLASILREAHERGARA